MIQRAAKAKRWGELLFLAVFVLMHAALLAAIGFMYLLAGSVAIMGEGDGGSSHAVRTPAAPTLSSHVQHLLIKLLVVAAIYSIFAPLVRRQLDFIATAGSIAIAIAILVFGALAATEHRGERGFDSGALLLFFTILFAIYSAVFVPAMIVAIGRARKKGIVAPQA